MKDTDTLVGDFVVRQLRNGKFRIYECEETQQVRGGCLVDGVGTKVTTVLRSEVGYILNFDKYSEARGYAERLTEKQRTAFRR